jgi:hypothetical protein
VVDFTSPNCKNEASGNGDHYWCQWKGKDRDDTRDSSNHRQAHSTKITKLEGQGYNKQLVLSQYSVGITLLCGFNGIGHEGFKFEGM